MRLLYIQKIGSEYDIVIEYPRSWWQRIRQQPVVRETFRGSGTVWHNLRTFQRAGTLKEYWLSEQLWGAQQTEAIIPEFASERT